MSAAPLSKRALALARAGLAAWRAGQIVLRPPVAALNHVRSLSQADPAQASLAWLENLAARHGAGPDEMVARPSALAGLTDAERAGLAQSDWRVGLSEDAIVSAAAMPATTQAVIARALAGILQGPARPSADVQPVPGEHDLWIYARPPLRLVYAADQNKHELIILQAEALAPDK